MADAQYTPTSALMAKALGVSESLMSKWYEPLKSAMAHASLNNPLRLASFLAQIGHESGSLRYTTELWGPTKQQLTYEGRLDLGNTQKGDGFRYRGHGLIQNTGRVNHRAATKGLARYGCPDFEAEPEKLAEPRWAALSAAEYWASHKLNAKADLGDTVAITRVVNGGTTGLADRLARFDHAKKALS